jgi:hypothetical protein
MIVTTKFYGSHLSAISRNLPMLKFFELHSTLVETLFFFSYEVCNYYLLKITENYFLNSADKSAGGVY